MPRWRCWEGDFDVEDETANFDTRNKILATNNVEDWLTLHTFESISKIHEKPSISVAVGSSRTLCVALDDFVCLFKDDSCSETIFTVDVGDVVECCCFIDEAEVVLIALRNGTLSCFDLQGCNLFKMEIPVDVTNGPTFIAFIIENKGKRKNDVYNVLLVSSHSDIYRISSNYVKLNHKCEVSVNPLRSGNTSMKVFTAISHTCDKWGVFLLGSHIKLWSEEIIDSYDLSALGFSVKKAERWKENSLICLTSCAKLAVLCEISLLCLNLWTDILVKDFTLQQKSSMDSEQLIAILTKSNCENEDMFVLLATLPEFNIVHKIKTMEPSWLIPSSCHLMYIEGFSLEGNTEKLKINVLFLNQPIQRLQQLLRKQKFSEAESLALKFGLAMEPVNEAHATHLIASLVSMQDHGVFEKLLFILDKIQNLQFITSLCLNHVLCHVESEKNLLRYGLKRLQMLTQAELRELVLEKKQHELYSRSYNLETYLFLKMDVPTSSVKWHHIFKANWFKIFKSYLKNGEVHKMEIIWLRHFKDNRTLSISELKQLFQFIPMDMKLKDIFMCLEKFIPHILDVAPYVTEDLADWIMQRARLMEGDLKEWPDNAITFVEHFQMILKKKLAPYQKKAFLLPVKKISDLNYFLANLNEIKLLKEEYCIKVPLQNFLMEDKLEVMAHILSKVHHQDIDKILSNYVEKFVEKHILTKDSVILHFVTVHLETIGEHWFHLAVNRWEPIIAKFIDHLVNVEMKIKCIIKVLTYASIPWSNTVEKLAHYGSKLKHRDVLEIKKLWKLVDIKLIFRKYQFDINLSSVKFQRSVSLFLIKRIVHCHRDTMVQDALVIAGDHCDLIVEVYTLCLHKLICDEKFLEAQNILEDLDPDIYMECCGRLLCRIECETDLSLLYNYLTFLKSSSFHATFKKYYSQDLEMVQNLLFLKLNFNCPLTCKEYFNLSSKTLIFKAQIELLVKDAVENECNRIVLYKRASLLAKNFGFCPADGVFEVMQLCKEIHDSNWTLEHCSKHKVKLLSQQLLREIEGGQENISYSRIMTCNILYHQLNINDAWLHILPWINRARDLSSVSLTKNIVSKVYEEDSRGQWRPEVVDYVCSVFFFIEGSVCKEEVLTKLQKALSSTKRKDILVMMLLSLNMFGGSVCISQRENVERMQQKLLEELFYKLLCSDVCDIHLACSVLLSMESSNAKQILQQAVQEFRFRYKRLDRLAELGIAFCTYKKHENHLSFFMSLRKECLWARCLQKHKISLDKTLAGEKPAVARKLIIERDVEIAEQFCRTFNINMQDLLSSCLESAILSWKPEYEVKVDNDGNSAIEVKNNEDATVRKCIDIAKRMDAQNLKNCLSSIWKKLNFYYYEMYVCIESIRMHVLQEEKTSTFVLLSFLRNYSRNSSIQAEERLIWEETFPTFHDMPEISKWRLPFCTSPSGQEIWRGMWKLVKAEFTLDNYELWFQIAEIMGLPKDTIRTIVLFLCESHLNANIPEDTEWCSTLINKKAITQIEKCSNEMENQEEACAALFYICGRVRGGADKVELVRLCLKRTTKWALSKKCDWIPDTLSKVKNLYLEVATKNVLYMYKLGLPCYLNKVLIPEILIRELYNHPKIISSLNLDSYWPGVNDAVNKIAIIHEIIGLNEFCLQLLLEWLTPFGGITEDFDDTITKVGTLQDFQICSEKAQENLLRASYLLRKEDSIPLFSDLLGIILDSDVEDNFQLRQNAIFAITKAVSVDQLSELCELSPEDIQKHFKTIQFVCDLNALGYTISLSQFQDHKVLDLVGELVGKASQNPFTICIASRLATEFGVLNSEVGADLLKNMVKFRMAEDLQRILGSVPATTSGIVEAWTYLLHSPFDNCNDSNTLTSDEIQIAVQRFLLLYRCPVTESIDLESLGALCCKIGRQECAALLLPFMFKESQQRLKKEILSKSSNEEIRMNLQCIEDEYVVSKVMAILEEI